MTDSNCDDLHHVRRLLQLPQNAHSPASLWSIPASLQITRRRYPIQTLQQLRHDRVHPLPNHPAISKAPNQPPPLPLLALDHPSSPSATRTDDVLLTGPDTNLTFADLMLPPFITTALSNSRLFHPSPVQFRAIPVARLGADIIAQAKSGTGKTIVFTVVALEIVAALMPSKPALAVLILSPTRELAMQIENVLKKLSAAMQPPPTLALLIGGLSEKEDTAKLAAAQPHIIVATPGRLLALINRGVVDVHALQLLVLDEADRLLDGNYDSSVPDICLALPNHKQTLAFSATYTPQLRQILNSVMRNPKHIRLFSANQSKQDEDVTSGAQDVSSVAHIQHETVLRGIRQQKCTTLNHRESSSPSSFTDKLNLLTTLLGRLPFNFCMLFTNDKSKGRAISSYVNQNGYQSVYTSAGVPQSERSSVMNSVRSGKIQVLVSTDLLARGVDFESCDIVVHMDIPRDPATYLHRVGRAGRFGKQGLSVLIYVGAEESSSLAALERKLGYRLQDCQLSINDSTKGARATVPTRSFGKRKHQGSAPGPNSATQPVQEKNYAVDRRLEIENQDDVLSKEKDYVRWHDDELQDDRVKTFSIKQIDWDAYARQAYEEGYEEGFTRASRIAHEVRSRLFEN